MLVTDAQVHLWEVDRPDRPWPAVVRNRPHGTDGYAADRMLPEMDAAGVDRAVIVPPTWVGENNATALEAAAAHPSRFAVMGRFDPGAPDARDRLQGWLQQPGMLGIRLTFQISPFREALDNGSLDWFWAECERLGIPLMLLLPGMPEKAQPIAARHPGLRIVIDHMACVLQAKGAEAFAGIDNLLALSSHANVYVKTSSAPCFSNEPYPFADLYPYLRRIYDAFGPRRLFWGADITRLTSTYSECLRHFKEGLDFLTSEDKEWILGKSLAEALRWPES
jgi:predicted TIM-barrel fold metal-dependent hydrolase